ncbi:hypothetical protein DVJ78_17340 [Humibacter sp. BT305]|nr:hypothetical protein DVJ78_17340 [Humibacter sp. BT305]
MTLLDAPSISPAAVGIALESRLDESLAVMLYGSHARGTNEPGSDIDVLELVADAPSPYSLGDMNVTQYTPGHLGGMAQRGSLFVLHLLTDGVIVTDPSGILAAALQQYRRPSSYVPIWNQLAIAAGAVNPNAPDASRFAVGLSRLALYTLRTAVYLHSIEAGEPCFDVDRAGEQLRIDRLPEVLRWRRRSDFSADDLTILSDLLSAVLPFRTPAETRSTVGYAVAHSSSPDLAALFTTVLGEGRIEYSALSVPPF